MLNALAPVLPGLIGGSADLAPSNLTLMKMFGDFQKGSYQVRGRRWMGECVRQQGRPCSWVCLAWEGVRVPSPVRTKLG